MEPVAQVVALLLAAGEASVVGPEGLGAQAVGAEQQVVEQLLVDEGSAAVVAVLQESDEQAEVLAQVAQVLQVGEPVGFVVLPVLGEQVAREPV